jgi:C4-dicarboxylate transporter DctM subunit
VAPVLLVFVVVIVGIYGGWANPTEAAAIGAAACGVLAVVSGGMRTKGLIDSALGHGAGHCHDLSGAAGC